MVEICKWKEGWEKEEEKQVALGEQAPRRGKYGVCEGGGRSSCAGPGLVLCALGMAFCQLPHIVCLWKYYSNVSSCISFMVPFQLEGSPLLCMSTAFVRAPVYGTIPALLSQLFMYTSVHPPKTELKG